MTNVFPGVASAGSTLSQIFLYQVMGQLVGGALAPYWRAFEYIVNERTPNAVLSPEELASAVVRGFLTATDATKEAKSSGIDAARFDTLVKITGQSLGPEALAVALRRGIIDPAGPAEGTSFESGIAQSNLANKWGPIVQQLATMIPTPELALDAYLEGQVKEDEARAKYALFGGAPEYFDLVYNTRGSAPTPVEAGLLANRGIIPWEDGEGPGSVSFKQAFLEGPWRNKWFEPMREYARYRPPPRTVTALLRNGSLTDEQAIGYFQDYGFTPELAAIYVRDGHHERKHAVHELARTTIERLYTDRVITRDETKTMLAAEGWSDADAEFLLQVVDLSLLHTHINAAIGRIRTLYSGYKLNREHAVSSLETLGITGDRQADLLSLWDLLRVDQMKHLTPAQIAAAMVQKVIDGAEALRLLEDQGYSAHDGWILLATRDKTLAGAEPPRGVPGGAPGFQT